MNPQERDALLERLRGIEADVIALEKVPSTFVMGAFYALGQATRIVQAAYQEHPTCLIHCRQATEE